MFAFVLTLAFVLMLVTFRSIVIAIKAVLLNLLSVAAAYGALVLVFQHGWGKSLLGFEKTGGIVGFLPIFLFVILFGLSMDYHVFILTRIREAYDGGMSTDKAVAHGIRTTAGVVTSAAIVMVGVFSVFATLQFMFLKQFGVGLAVAVLVDATVVRAVLLPATMKLLGDWNWYLPRWLEWLPRTNSHRRRGTEMRLTDRPTPDRPGPRRRPLDRRLAHWRGRPPGPGPMSGAGRSSARTSRLHHGQHCGLRPADDAIGTSRATRRRPQYLET